jgi:hypothetical protein
VKFFTAPQLSDEWWKLKVGKISGTRFGQVLSGRKNRLIYELMNEILNGQCDMSIFCNDEMQYGLDNEPEALRLYSDQINMEITKTGAILSEENIIHMASPDGISLNGKIIQEVKCTPNGEIHLERIFEGIDIKYLPQCINYFAVSPEIEEVHFISYCGYRIERPLHIIKLLRSSFTIEIEKGIEGVKRIEKELNKKLDEYKF